MTPDTLAVWLGNDHVGELSRGRRQFEMRFTRQSTSPPITVSTDGDTEQWTPSFTKAWFDGLLPEETRRTEAEVAHGIERGDTFGLLGAIGWECAGAVSVLPDDVQPGSGSYEPLSDDEVWERLDALPRTVGEADTRVRLSLGGAQEKLLLAKPADRWQLPIDGAASTHILKPEPALYPGLAIAEAWALSAASRATVAAKAMLLEEDGHRPTIVVERYDRLRDGNSISRIHQEDGCQVLGLPPERKYPNGVGPKEVSLRRFADLLLARAMDPIVELRRLLEQTVINVALLNTDAHGKNHSFLHTGGGTVSLAPLYDIAPTLWFLPGQPKAALSVGGKWRIEEIERRHLFEEATGWGMPSREAAFVIGETLEALSQGIENADAAYPSAPSAMLAKVRLQVARLLRTEQ